MTETGNRNRCSICGDPIETPREHDSLCEQCTDAWQREVESPW